MPDSAAAIIAAGAPLRDARAVVVMLHGRGATAEDILSLNDELGQDVAYLAPQAPGYSWYPRSFLAPLEQNEPFLSRSLATIAVVLSDLAGEGIALDRVMLLRFSQGGCLALEFVARQARQYRGVVGLSAGLIGPPGLARNYQGSLADTPDLHRLQRYRSACSSRPGPRVVPGARRDECSRHGAYLSRYRARNKPGRGRSRPQAGGQHQSVSLCLN